MTYNRFSSTNLPDLNYLQNIQVNRHSYISFDYDIYLRRFFNTYKNQTELDYIKKEIEHFETILHCFSQLTEENLLNRYDWVNNMKISAQEIDEYKKYLFEEYGKSKLKENIRQLKDIIKELNFKKTRLQQLTPKAPMFKNFKSFLNNVRTGNVDQIDIEEYIFEKSNKHEIEKLNTILKDIEFYLFVEKDFMISEINEKDWEEKHKYYKDKGEETPLEKVESGIHILKKLKGEDTTNTPEYYYRYNEESLFFPFEFFCIRQLEKYVSELINKKSGNPQTNPFPDIFIGTDNKPYLLFKSFVENHLIDKYTDFSFIFQQMKFNNYISDVKHFYFMKWLKSNNFITEKEYMDFEIEKGFKSLGKCKSDARLNYYIKLKEKIFS